MFKFWASICRVASASMFTKVSCQATVTTLPATVKMFKKDWNLAPAIDVACPKLVHDIWAPERLGT